MSILATFKNEAMTPGLKLFTCRIEGRGTSVPVIVAGGEGVVVTRVGVGIYDLTLNDKPGRFVAAPAPGSNNAAVSSGGVVVDWVEADNKFRIQTRDAADAAVDIAASQFVSVLGYFQSF